MQLPSHDVSQPPLFESWLVESGEARLLRTLLWDALLSGPDASGLTQVEAASRSSISRPSVKNYIDDMPSELFADGPLALAPNAGYALGVDFGRTHAVKVALTDMCGTTCDVAGSSGATDEIGLNPSETIDRAVGRIQEVLPKSDVEVGKLVGIGIGLPTPAVGQSPSDAAIGHWKRRNPADQLRKALNKKLPRYSSLWKRIYIGVDTDTNLSAIHNHLWGAEHAADTVYIKWLAGVRTALILNNQLYRGSSNAAGELPHVPVAGSTEPCGMKKCPVGPGIGCLYGAAPIERIREFTTSVLGRHLLWAGQIMDAASENEELQTHLENVAYAIGQAVAPVATSLNPSLIVIGGAFGTRAYDTVLDEFARGFEEHTRPGGDGEVVITSSTHQNTTVEGAAALALLEYGTQFLLARASGAEALLQAV
jgi:glucokinase